MCDEMDSKVEDTIRAVVQRAELLDSLAGGPVSKRDLREELDVSRSTVYKAVRDLEAQGLVAEGDAGPRLTLVGRLVTDRFRSFAGTVSDVRRFESLLAVLPADAPVTADVLTDGELVRAERHAPARPVARVEELVRGADRASALAPVALPQYVDVFYEELTSGGLTADIVVEPPVAEYLRTDYPDELAAAAATGRLSLVETDATLPFGLVVVETDGADGANGTADGEASQSAAGAEIAFIAYDDGDLRGLIVNDTPAALDWGRRTFESYRDDATPVDLE